MRNYIGLIRKKPGGGYGVSFPDFPGLAIAEASLDDARFMAEEILTLRVEGLVDEGDAVPEPSTLEAIMSDPENRDGVAILVTVMTEAPQNMCVLVSLPVDVLQQIDRYAAENGLTRSGFVTQAAKRALAGA